MTDVREEILARLAAVLATIPNVRHTARNSAVNIPDTRLPAAVLFDGDEETADDKDDARPRKMRLRPEIVLVEQSAEAGSDLSTLRSEMIKRIETDAPLWAIIGTNGKITYDGCVTDFGYGRTLQGGMIAQIIIQYVLIPQQL
jgi:hypothetical protein